MPFPAARPYSSYFEHSKATYRKGQVASPASVSDPGLMMPTPHTHHRQSGLCVCCVNAWIMEHHGFGGCGGSLRCDRVGEKTLDNMYYYNAEHNLNVTYVGYSDHG